MKKIAVVGSVNMDFFVESDTLPKFGETVIGKDFFMGFGGKGANQSVAASRLEGDVSFFGSVGNDKIKDNLLKHLKRERINIQHVNVVENVSTGTAFIQLYKEENRIIITPGANLYTNQSYAKKTIEILLNYDIFLFQLEIPLETLEYLIPILYEHKKTIILDPAPAKQLTDKLIKKVTYLIPNEHEFSIINKKQDTMGSMLKRYPNKLIITCGGNGAMFHNGDEIISVPAEKVNVVDTTGAGDAFTGAFTVAISEGKSLEKSIRFAVHVAGVSTTKKGAQSGMPLKKEVDSLLKEG